MDDIDDETVREEDLFPSLSGMLEEVLTPQIMVDNENQISQDDTLAYAMYVDTLTLDLPIEIQTLRDEEKQMQLGVSPPTQWLETSVMPVWHRVRVTLECDEHGEKG